MTFADIYIYPTFFPCFIQMIIGKLYTSQLLAARCALEEYIYALVQVFWPDVRVSQLTIYILCERDDVFYSNEEEEFFIK